MDFSPKTFGDHKVQYFDSKKDSEIQIVFIPGTFNSKVWKHQIKYFSKNYRTITFERDSYSYEEQKEIVRGILNRKGLENAVLISAGPGNMLTQEFEDRKRTIATVLTSAAESYPKVSKNKYSILKNTVFRKPKLAHKTFFSEKTDYRIARDLLEDLEIPEHENLSSFIENYELKDSIKNSLIIHPENDQFASREKSCSMKPEARISIIKTAGPFSFYEKPEEYNKAVHDFLEKLESFAESKKVRETRERNHSLSQFEQEKQDSSENSKQKSKERAVLWE